MSLFEYSSAFLFGFLGGFHCAGMCGGFVASLSLTGKRAWIPGVAAYQFSRVAIYIFMGIVTAAAGSLFLKTGAFGNAQKILSFLAGVLVIFMALQVGSWMPEKFGLLSKIFRIPPTLIKKVREGNSLSSWVLLGSLNGFLPCGLVYAALAMVLEKANLFSGALVMFFFGLGTMPWLFGVAWVMKSVEPSVRSNFIKVAALCVAAFGLFLIFKSTPLYY